MHLVVLVVLVVLVMLIELVEVTKICQVPGSWKIRLGPSGTDFCTPGSIRLLTGGTLSQLTTERGLAGQVTHKTWNSSKSSEIGQWHTVTFFFFLQKNDSYQDTVWDSRLGAYIYHWNFRDLVLLLRRLQVRSPRIPSSYLERAWAPDKPKKPGWVRGLFQRWEIPSSSLSTILANELQSVKPHRSS